jgi:hypothetical protein
MTSSKKESFYHERDLYGHPTGLTVCRVGEYLGYAFCHPGKVIEKSITAKGGKKALLVIQDQDPDAYNKKIGKTVAKGRAEKLTALLQEGLAFDEAVTKVYSGRMLKRIAQWYVKGGDILTTWDQALVATPEEDLALQESLAV